MIKEGDLVEFDTSKEEPYYSWGDMEGVELICVLSGVISELVEEDKMSENVKEAILSAGYPEDTVALQLDHPILYKPYFAVGQDVIKKADAEEVCPRYGEKVETAEGEGVIFAKYTDKMFAEKKFADEYLPSDKSLYLVDYGDSWDVVPGALI